MLNWANQFSIFCFLDSCDFQSEDSVFQWKLAVNAVSEFNITDHASLEKLDKYISSQQNCIFGHLSYDLRNIIDGNKKPATDGFGYGYFFVPEILIEFKNETIFISSADHTVFDQINSFSVADCISKMEEPLHPLQNKNDYLEAISKIKMHIQAGDCYELNYCMKYEGRAEQFNIVETYFQLTTLSPVPFGSLYKKDGLYCMCASPERYIKTDANIITSQPIKGTAKRYPGDELQDDMDKLKLYGSIKDRTENVMTVDLVRNDLSRICMAGTVKVSELFGIYSFATVHQMISTITGQLKRDIKFSDILKATFPMGSMTGAPKKKVMELIDQLEITGRGLFSGSIGYITPDGNADLNVVIRSIFYDYSTGKIWSYAGGAITHMSEPQNEWEECNLKLMAVRKSLED